MNVSAHNVFANPGRYAAVLKRCNITVPHNLSDLQLPTSGKFDFLCLFLLDITTQAQCEAYTGGRGLNDWTRYIAIDIWTRVEVWKIPLVLLLIQFARSPLAWHTHFFTILHLLGDPIQTLTSLLHTLATCQERALRLKKEMESFRATKLAVWKLYALILVSYNECGKSGGVAEFITASMILLESSTEECAEIRNVFHNTAYSLAADRQTKSLPIIYSLFLFIHAFVFAFYKTDKSDKASLEHPNGKWASIEAHSIAFSALLLWLIPAVFLSAIIGVSQTDEEIARKLNHFREQLVKMKANSDREKDRERKLNDFREQLAKMKTDSDQESDVEKMLKDMDANTSDFPPIVKFPDNLEIPAEIPVSPTGSEDDSKIKGNDSAIGVPEQFGHGQIYSCQPSSLERPLRFHTTALLLVASSLGVACIISEAVPPVSFTCRLQGEMVALVVWVISWLADFIILKSVSIEAQYRAIFWKDFVSGSMIFILIVITQWGVFNRCSCYSSPIDGTIANPLYPWVDAILDRFFFHDWFYIILGAIFFQLAMSAVLSWWYIVALRVYLQRSDGRSNFHNIQIAGPLLEKTARKLEQYRFLLLPGVELKVELVRNWASRSGVRLWNWARRTIKGSDSDYSLDNR